jgi:hypothetical protein
MSDAIGRIKASIPGTAEYEQQHGMDEWHALAEQAKSYIPGQLQLLHQPKPFMLVCML